MRPSIVSVTNDGLPPCLQTQSSCFNIWTATIVVLCLFYVFTYVTQHPGQMLFKMYYLSVQHHYNRGGEGEILQEQVVAELSIHPIL